MWQAKLCTVLILASLCVSLGDAGFFGSLLGDEDTSDVPFMDIFSKPKHHWALPVGKPATGGSMFCTKGTLCGADGKCKATCQGNCCKEITKRKTFMLPQAKPGTRTEVLEPDAFGAFLSPLKAQHFESQPKPASFEFVLSPPIKPLSFPPIKRFQVPKMFQELLTPLNNMLGDNWLKPKDASFDTSFGSGLAHTLTSAADATDDFMDAFGKSMPMHFELAFPSMAQHTTQKSNGGGLSLSAPTNQADMTAHATSCVRSMKCVQDKCQQTCNGSCCAAHPPPHHQQPKVTRPAGAVAAARKPRILPTQAPTTLPTTLTAPPTAAPTIAAKPAVKIPQQDINSRFIAYAALRAKKVCGEKLKNDADQFTECEKRATQLLQLARQAEM